MEGETDQENSKPSAAEAAKSSPTATDPPAAKSSTGTTDSPAAKSSPAATDSSAAKSAKPSADSNVSPISNVTEAAAGQTSPSNPGSLNTSPTDALPQVSPVKDGEGSKPPLARLYSVSDYDSTTYDEAMVPPPTYEEALQESLVQDTETAINILSEISEEVARTSLVDHAGQTRCYGTKAAREMNIETLVPTPALIYTLETFAESRLLVRTHEPYQGQPVDGPENGLPPSPWDILIKPKQPFHDSSMHVEVPHTAYVDLCHHCKGARRVRCSACGGRGQVQCNMCYGSGWERGTAEMREHCHKCVGTGIIVCGDCQGAGVIRCVKCIGFGRLKYFVRLTIIWRNHVDKYVENKTKLVTDITHSSGQLIFMEKGAKVKPLSHIPRLAEVSSQLLKKHKTEYRDELRLSQRHQVWTVPVTEVSCNYRDKAFNYTVYGFEHKVSVAGYPHRCCWRCAIM